MNENIFVVTSTSILYTVIQRILVKLIEFDGSTATFGTYSVIRSPAGT